MVGPKTARDARNALADYQDALDPTPSDQIERMITKLAALYPSARVSEAEAGAKIELYGELLSDIPFDILSRAFLKAGQTCRFFPSVAEIRELAGPELALRHWRMHVLRRLVWRHENEWKPPFDPKNRVTKEEIREIMKKAGIKPADEELEKRRTRSKARAGHEKASTSGRGQSGKEFP